MKHLTTNFLAKIGLITALTISAFASGCSSAEDGTAGDAPDLTTSGDRSTLEQSTFSQDEQDPPATTKEDEDTTPEVTRSADTTQPTAEEPDCDFTADTSQSEPAASEAVQATREQILEALSTCDEEALAALAPEDRRQTTSNGDVVIFPGEFMQPINGLDFSLLAVALLAPGAPREGGWVFPGILDKDCDQLTDDERQLIDQLDWADSCNTLLADDPTVFVPNFVIDESGLWTGLEVARGA